MSTLEQTPIACPLPWSRVLRKNPAALPRDARPSVEAWLRWQNWCPQARDAWRDPLDGDVHCLASAAKVQLVREAQHHLEQARGWELTGGAACPDTGWWSVTTWELHKPGLRGFHSITQALAREGMLDQPVPALQPLVPRLRLVRGGRAA